MENASLANASLALGQTAAALQPAPAAVLAPIVAACVVAVVGAASAGLLHSPLPARSSAAAADAAGAAGAAGRRDEKKRAISWAEFKAHSGGGKARAWREGPLWIAIHGKVYDIGGFAASHPGGPLITSMAGRDASDVFMAMHMPRVQSRLPPLCVGELTDAPPPKPVTRDYRALRTRLWKEGWFEADLGYVAWKDCLTAGIFLLGLLAVNCAPSAFGRVGTPPASLPPTPSPACSPTVRLVQLLLTLALSLSGWRDRDRFVAAAGGLRRPRRRPPRRRTPKARRRFQPVGLAAVSYPPPFFSRRCPYPFPDRVALF